MIPIEKEQSYNCPIKDLNKRFRFKNKKMVRTRNEKIIKDI